jgi:hypothetical protein
MSTERPPTPLPPPTPPTPSATDLSGQTLTYAVLQTVPTSPLTAVPPINSVQAPAPINPKSRHIPEAKHAEINTLTLYEFKDVDKMMNEDYTYPETNNSTVCDIIAMYLKGQKILYTEAKTVCEVRLHYLMLPAILITAAAAILSMILREQPFGATVVAVLNSVNTFLLTLINYLKLDARAEAHRTAAYKFDKLQSYMEFSSGRILFDMEASEQLTDILKKVENDVREIKETNQFILPEKIRFTYPKLYSTNVFAEVKRIQNQENLWIDKMRNILNDLQRLSVQTSTQEIENTKKELEIKRAQVNETILLIKNQYLGIDKTFEEELEKYRGSYARRCDCCGWLKS